MQFTPKICEAFQYAAPLSDSFPVSYAATLGDHWPFHSCGFLMYFFFFPLHWVFLVLWSDLSLARKPNEEKKT